MRHHLIHVALCVAFTRATQATDGLGACAIIDDHDARLECAAIVLADPHRRAACRASAP